MTTETKPDNPFLKQLERLIKGDKNRGNRAALRRYWSPTTRSLAYPLLGQLGALWNNSDAKAILAALYAEHPEHKKGQSVGKAAFGLGDRDKDGKHPYDSHFRRLLACDDLDDLAKQLHRLVKRLQRESVALDYESLLINLYTWTKTSEPHKREDVKVRWAADFWQAPIQTVTETEVTEV